MSYCRFGSDSDVYAYGRIDGGFSIHVTAVKGKGTHWYLGEDDLKGFYLSMKRIRAEGYKIPDRTFQRIEKELNGSVPRED
jgi:hypothetical protein